MNGKGPRLTPALCDAAKQYLRHVSARKPAVRQTCWRRRDVAAMLVVGGVGRMRVVVVQAQRRV